MTFHWTEMESALLGDARAEGPAPASQQEIDTLREIQEAASPLDLMRGLVRVITLRRPQVAAPAPDKMDELVAEARARLTR